MTQTETTLEIQTDQIAGDCLLALLADGDRINVTAGSNKQSHESVEGIDIVYSGKGSAHESIDESEYRGVKGERFKIREADNSADIRLRAMAYDHNRQITFYRDTQNPDALVYRTQKPGSDDENPEYKHSRLTLGEGFRNTVYAIGPRGALYGLFRSKHGGIVAESLRAKDGTLGYVVDIEILETAGDDERTAESLIAAAKNHAQEKRDAWRKRGLDGYRYAGGDETADYVLATEKDGDIVLSHSDAQGTAHIQDNYYVHHYKNSVYQHLVFENDYAAIVETGANDAIKETDRSSTHWGYDNSSYEWHFAKESLKTILTAVLTNSELDSVSVPLGKFESHFAGWDDLRDLAAENPEYAAEQPDPPETGDDDSFRSKGESITDEETTESVMDEKVERSDYEERDDGGIEAQYFRDTAEREGKTPKEVHDAMATYRIYAFYPETGETVTFDESDESGRTDGGPESETQNTRDETDGESGDETDETAEAMTDGGKRNPRPRVIVIDPDSQDEAIEPFIAVNATARDWWRVTLTDGRQFKGRYFRVAYDDSSGIRTPSGDRESFDVGTIDKIEWYGKEQPAGWPDIPGR